MNISKDLLVGRGTGVPHQSVDFDKINPEEDSTLKVI